MNPWIWKLVLYLILEILGIALFMHGLLLFLHRRKGVNGVNLNDFAKEITEEEGLKESLSIAQVKEVLRITLKKLAKLSFGEVAVMIGRIK